jgi:putative transcriptional regulator
VTVKRALLALGLLLAMAAPFTAARSVPETAPHESSLAGQLLVAEPEMGDPRFQHTVILLVRHDKSGALGIIINRPVEERSLASVLQAIGQGTTGITGNVRLYAGGPVEPQIGFIVHSADYHISQTVDIDGRVAMTSSPEVLQDIGHGKGPKKSLIAFGYAGWGPGQLEGELAQHGWFTIPDDPRLVFDMDRDKVWDAAIARRTVPL